MNNQEESAGNQSLQPFLAEEDQAQTTERKNPKQLHSPPFSPAQTPQKPVPNHFQSFDRSNVFPSDAMIHARQFQSSIQTNEQNVRKASDLPTEFNNSTGGANHKKQNYKIIREKYQQMKNQAVAQSNFNSISLASNDASQSRSITTSIANFQALKGSVAQSLDNSEQFISAQSPFKQQGFHMNQTLMGQSSIHQKTAIAQNQHGQDLNQNSTTSPWDSNSFVNQSGFRPTPQSKKIGDGFSTSTGKQYSVAQLAQNSNFKDVEMAPNPQFSNQENQQVKEKQDDDKENQNINSNSDKGRKKVLQKLIEQQKNNSLRALSGNRHGPSGSNASQISMIHKSLLRPNYQNSNASSPQFMGKIGKLNTSASFRGQVQQPKVIGNIKKRDIGGFQNSLSLGNIGNKSKSGFQIIPNKIECTGESTFFGVNQDDRRPSNQVESPKILNSISQMARLGNLQIESGGFRIFDVDQNKESLSASIEQENEFTIPKIQQLNLGLSSSIEKESAHGSMAFPKEMEIEENNDQTMNSMNMQSHHSNETKPRYSKEREYDQAQLENPENGPSELNLGQIEPLIMIQQVSEGNNLVRINSNILNNKNDNTNSSLGKRNYAEFQKTAQNKKEKEEDLYQIDENSDIEKRVRKTPARRLKQMIRSNSDNLIVVQSASKLQPPQDHSHENVSRVVGGIQSDQVLSSGGPDSRKEHLVNFQKMGYAGHNHLMANQFNQKQLKQQFSGDGSSFDNVTQNNNSENAPCQACMQEQQHFPVPVPQLDQTIQQMPPGKLTPVFFKQNLKMNMKELIKNHQDKQKKPFEYTPQNIQVQGQNEDGFKHKESNFPHVLYAEQSSSRKDEISEESEEGQFERDGEAINEEPSTNTHTEMPRPQTENKGVMQINSTVKNFGQIYFNNNMSIVNQNHPILGKQHSQIMQPVTQMKQPLMQTNQDSNIKRQLSFTSNSNASSNIQTPMQKRIKQTSQNNSTAQGSRIFQMVQNMNQTQPFAEPLSDQRIPEEMKHNFRPELRKSNTTKEGGSPESVYSRWRRSDPIFMNKYSSGATPPQKRNSRLSLQNNMVLADDFRQRSKTLYFAKPENQTMNSDNNSQIIIISPSLQQVRNSDPCMDDLVDINQNMSQRKFQIDQQGEDQRQAAEQPQDMMDQEPRVARQMQENNIFNSQMAKTLSGEPNLYNEVIQEFQSYNQNASFFQSMNEKNLNSNQVPSLLKQDSQVMVTPKNNLQPHFQAQSIPRNLSDISRVNSQNYNQIYAQQLSQMKMQNGPFAEQRHGSMPMNNFMCKTNSSMSNTMSVHTCQKRQANVDGRSTGGPKTPVHNNHGIQQRSSQVSATNTSANQQESVISSFNDTEQEYTYGKKNKRPKYNNFTVNQFGFPAAVSPFQIGGPTQTSSMPTQQQQIMPVKSLFQQPASNSMLSGNTGSNELNQSSLKNQFAQFQKSQLSPFKMAAPSPKQLSWLDQEFTYISKIGKGHFGYVLKCRNNTDQFEYAIKVTKSRISNPSEHSQYLQEMQTLSAISVESECPHIVRYFNSWIEHDKIHIVMELCEKSLQQVKKEAKQAKKQFNKQNIQIIDQTDLYQGHINEEYLRKIGRDCLLGLSELHNQDIVHLDIKPGNILKGKNKNYKLGDLGMSRFLTKITSENNIPEGDCRYLAKELLSRDMLSHVPDLKKSDIFSLGITMYELLTLTDLEKNGSEWLSFRNGTFKYPDIVETIYSKELLNAIRVMLSERTDDRPCADELLHQVFKSQEDRQIDQLEQENQQLKFNQQQLLEFLQQNGIDVSQVAQNLNLKL